MKIHLLTSCSFVFGLVISGCPSTSTLHTARPIPKKSIEITINPTISGAYIQESKPIVDDQGQNLPSQKQWRNIEHTPT